MAESTLITNARLVNEGRVFESDLLIRNQRIERIDPEIRAPNGARICDASGSHLLPGMIDDQVHFREPGMTHKGSIYSESRAAVAGGVTSFMDMPNTKPPTIDHAGLAHKHAIASSDAAANWSFYLGATNDNIEEIRRVDRSLACGIKVFMGSSTGNMLVDDPDALNTIFRDAPLLIATHCEYSPEIEANVTRAMRRYGEEIPVTLHPDIRSAAACFKSTEIAVSLARAHDARLHVLHLSTARELDFFEPGPPAGKRITAETCIHFLHFSRADFATLGNRIKCNPAIKTAADRDALIGALADGRINVLATDHAPHTLEEKGSPSYLRAPAGMPLVQDVLLAGLELVRAGRLDLATLVARAMHDPAEVFQISNRGFLREGYWADLVLVDLQSVTEVTPERVLAHCGWSPFEGRRFHSRIGHVWINGAPAFDGQRVLEHDAARALEFEAA